ncbi:MAG: type II secretion system protein [Lachnospiraceae bacterium]|nr:type II secretion system protein [Lachnospiraceae bacterium]
MKNEMKKKNNKGFSLVELIVVIAIMAVLMVVLAPAMLRYVEKTRIQKDESAVSEVINAVNIALSEEAINEDTKANDTILVGNKSITPGTGAKELVAEVTKTIDPTKMALSSKQFTGRTYTIKIVEKNGTLQAEEYKGYVSETNTGNWSAKSGS